MGRGRWEEGWERWRHGHELKSILQQKLAEVKSFIN
jgi:hypothetical protein